jgi:hypothetical protein
MSSTNRGFLTQIRPKPSPYKQQLRELSISGGAVANYVGLTYPYVMNMLNGAYHMTERTQTKIIELMDLVKQTQN